MALCIGTACTCKPLNPTHRPYLQVQPRDRLIHASRGFLGIAQALEVELQWKRNSRRVGPLRLWCVV
eukprot:6082116-Amphidinium_carterae.1